MLASRRNLDDPLSTHRQFLRRNESADRRLHVFSTQNAHLRTIRRGSSDLHLGNCLLDLFHLNLAETLDFEQRAACRGMHRLEDISIVSWLRAPTRCSPAYGYSVVSVCFELGDVGHTDACNVSTCACRTALGLSRRTVSLNAVNVDDVVLGCVMQ